MVLEARAYCLCFALRALLLREFEHCVLATRCTLLSGHYWRCSQTMSLRIRCTPSQPSLCTYGSQLLRDAQGDRRGQVARKRSFVIPMSKSQNENWTGDEPAGHAVLRMLFDKYKQLRGRPMHKRLTVQTSCGCPDIWYVPPAYSHRPFSDSPRTLIDSRMSGELSIRVDRTIHVQLDSVMLP